MDYTMTPEEEVELAKNIANLKDKITFQKKGSIHSFLISMTLIIIGFIGVNMGYTVIPYTLCGLALIGLFVTYKFFYWCDFNTHVLMSIEKSDLMFFMNNPK